MYHGFCTGASNSSAINCCSSGLLKIIDGNTLSTSSVILNSGNTITNSYYLDGIVGTTGITPETKAILFYKTSDDPEVMTSEKVRDELNSYIMSNPEGVSTVGWCQWIVSEDNLPILDFNTEWNGTEWVTVNN